MKWLMLFIFLASITNSAIGDSIHDTFGTGVFDTKWGASIHDIEAIYPEGIIKSYSNVTHYQIKDGRTVLEIARTNDDSIVFAFNADDQLISVGVYYDGYEEITTIMTKLETLFGKYQIRKNENTSAPIREWVGEDVSLSLILLPAMFNTQTIFGIEYTGYAKLGKQHTDAAY